MIIHKGLPAGDGEYLCKYPLQLKHPDAFASIIANVTKNQVLKRLSVITIVLTFPVLIASLFGMNVPNGFEHSPYAFYLVVLFSLAIALALAGYFFVKKYSNPTYAKNVTIRVYGLLINVFFKLFFGTYKVIFQFYHVINLLRVLL
ncbi:MAG: hypothetical protein NVV59_01500 [Chitinophagaceae bacterium]|nr:hypothetical protein [Chitinophagaceae bacterium]